MTLLFFDGFDNVLTVPKPEWDASAWAANQVGRDGSTNGAASMVSSGSKLLTLPSAAATCVLGLAVRVTTTSTYGLAQDFVGFRTGALTANSVTFNFDATGRLQVRTGTATGTVLAVGATAFALNTWLHLAIKVTSSATALSVAVYINGSATADLTYSGAAASSQTAAITKVLIGNDLASSPSAIWYDDLYVCDTVDATATQGRPNNDVLGDLKVTTLLPTGVGASTAWTPSTGTSNVALVGENPPNQTDYVSAATTGLRDTYDTADLPATTTTVYALRVGAYAQKSDAGTANVKPLVRESNGTLDGSTVVALGTGWGAAYGNLLTRKGDASLWTVADVNAAQVGIESA